jgi:hypothetical protein
LLDVIGPHFTKRKGAKLCRGQFRGGNRFKLGPFGGLLALNLSRVKSSLSQAPQAVCFGFGVINRHCGPLTQRSGEKLAFDTSLKLPMLASGLCYPQAEALFASVTQ